MSPKILKNIVERWDGNPVISLSDLAFQASDIHNAGAARFEGRYVLLVTVESLQGDCSIYKAVSDDGRRFTIDESPFLSSSDDGAFLPYEEQGVRDPRITPYDGTFYIVYQAESTHGVRLALARTQDFETVERVAMISEPDTKNGLLFPRKIDGRFARLERPREGGNIWVSYSDDMIHWGGWDCVMTPRHGYWDYDRIGGAAPPIETPCGWLLVYYGVRNTPSGPLFRLGLAFLELDEPTNVCGRSNIPILAPQKPYERIGDVGNLVFCCGALLSEDESELEIYYGAADSCICLGTVPLEELHRICMAEKAKGLA